MPPSTGSRYQRSGLSSITTTVMATTTQKMPLSRVLTAAAALLIRIGNALGDLRYAPSMRIDLSCCNLLNSQYLAAAAAKNAIDAEDDSHKSHCV